MRFTFTRTPDGAYSVAGDDIPPMAVRRNGRTWQYTETAPDGSALWWRGTFRTRQSAAEEGFTALSLDRDRDRARDALAVMDGARSFDSVAGPREEWSPGARFCLRVWDAAREHFDESDDYTPGDYDGLYNAAACLSPIYTDHTWRLWVDLGAYDFSEVDEEQNERQRGESVTTWAQGILTRMAETAMIQLCDAWHEERKCDECDEYPCECHVCADCLGDMREGASPEDRCACSDECRNGHPRGNCGECDTAVQPWYDRPEETATAPVVLNLTPAPHAPVTRPSANGDDGDGHADHCRHCPEECAVSNLAEHPGTCGHCDGGCC